MCSGNIISWMLPGGSLNLTPFSEQKGQIVSLPLLHILFRERRRFALEGGFEFFDEGITQRRFAEAQAQLLAFRERNSLLFEQIPGEYEFWSSPFRQGTPYLVGDFL